MKIVVLQIFLVTFLCSPQFLLTNTTGVEKNINSNETERNITGEVDAMLTDDYNNGNSNLEPSININDNLIKNDLEYRQSTVDNPILESESILSNDTPVILAFSESSTFELDKLVDTPLVSTSISESDPKNTSFHEKHNIDGTKTNITVNGNIAENQTHSEDSVEKKNMSANQNEEIPSFSEWAQKRLEEVEKNEQINSSLKGQAVNGKGATAKLRWKNYASLDCGAKVIAANPESVSPGAVLSPSSDEYKLNTCSTRIWFVVELCEAIQTKRIDLANYELFSSSPKDFVVSVSDRYPTRDWSVVGKFTAKDERDIQSFDLDTPIFGKYIKVEIKSHYGSEHYCPISLFRAYGTSIFEVLQKEDPGNVNPPDEDDDDDDQILSLNEDHDESQKNLFSSATDAVMSIVKRAAEVLGNKVNNHTAQENNKTLNLSSRTDVCNTPSHIILCKNCSESFFDQVYETISCDSHYIKKLLEIPLLYKTFNNSRMCHSFGHEIDTLLNTSQYINSFKDYIFSFFPFKYISAMCHEVSVTENRGILNASQQFSNRTGNITAEQAVNLKVQEPLIKSADNASLKLEKLTEVQFPNLSSISNYTSKTNFQENVTYASQIKPTKTLTSEVQFSQTDAVLNAENGSELLFSSEKGSSSDSAESFSTENFVENSIDSTTEIEGIDALDDNLEHLIDYNSTSSQNLPASSSTSTTNTPQPQKESVFLRLSNRIKVLERNMSLSSQYLEELSKRYKKQVEEMQHLLEKTIVTLREETQTKDLRNKQLEDRLDNLTAVIESLVAERHNWILSMYCLMTTIFLLLGVYFFCCKSAAYSHPAREGKEVVEVLRRKSIDIVTHNTPLKKKRRPSDQALKIVRCSTVSCEEDKHKLNNQRQRKRKKRNFIGSNSISNVKDNYLTDNIKSEDNTNDWIERNHQVIENIPFALEESDHTTLEAYPLENVLTRLHETGNVTASANFKSVENSSQTHEYQNTPHENFNISETNELFNKVFDSPEPVKKEKKSFKKLFKKVF